jgi:hypothetical protein
MNEFARRMAVITGMSLLLASCGGGATVGSLSECAELTPGVKFIRSNGNLTWIVQEMFEGQPAFGEVKLSASGVREGVDYQTVSGSFIHLLGFIGYDENGVPDYKNVFSKTARISVNMAPGETILLNFTDTETGFDPPVTSTSTDKAIKLLFSGFENLTLGGREFESVCKIIVPDVVQGQYRVTWIAKGFGVVQEEIQDVHGVTLPDSRIVLTQIVASPDEL